VLDNASSNDTAVDELGEELNFDATWRRLRCVGHVLNLIARSILFGKDYELLEKEVANIKDFKQQVELWRKKGPVGMIHTIVQWIDKSPGRVSRFNKVQRDIWYQNNRRLTGTPKVWALIHDNSTR
jgi:hypothetical protein